MQKSEIDLEGVKKFDKTQLKQTVTKVPNQSSERDGLMMNIRKGKSLTPTKTVNSSQERTKTLHSIKKGVSLQPTKTVNLTEDRKTVLQDIKKGGVNLKKSVTHDAAQDRREVLSEIKKGGVGLKHTETKDKSIPVVSLFAICIEQQTEINELKGKLNKLIKVVENKNRELNYLKHNVGLILNHTQNYLELISDLRGRFDVDEPNFHMANIEKPPENEDLSKVLESIKNFSHEDLKKSIMKKKNEERLTLLQELQKKRELRKVITKNQTGEWTQLLRQVRKGPSDLRHVETIDKVETRKGLMREIRQGKKKE